MSKEDFLKAKRSKGLVSIADIIQNEKRNEGRTVDIRELILSRPPGSRFLRWPRRRKSGAKKGDDK